MKEAELTLKEVFELAEKLPEDFIISIDLEVDDDDEG